MGVTKWKMTLHTSVMAVDRVSSLVTGGEATGDDWEKFLFCVVRLYLLGVGRYPDSCLLISGHWQVKHSAGADKLVCRSTYFVGADMRVCRHCLCSVSLSKFYKNTIITFNIKTSCLCLCRPKVGVHTWKMFLDLLLVINMKPNTGVCVTVLYFSLMGFNYVQLSG